jgi:diguanylate cyclase (GGDEF)-like protein
VPLLHASVFLLPNLLPVLGPSVVGASASEAWVTALTLATLLYAVGTAFLILALVQDRSIRFHKDAAALDPLTGLFNRRAFLESAQELIAERTGDRRPVTVLMFDLDNFKGINDRYGHAIGDETLRAFAKTACANMRVDDVIGRLGGEEFAAVVPGDGAIAVGIAERVRAAFEQAAAEVAGRPINATVSIGAAWTVENVSAGLVLADADAALYRAKAAGRNRVVLAAQPVSAPDSGRDLPAAAPGDGDDRRAWRNVELEVRPARGWPLEGRQLLRAAGGFAGVLDRDEQGLVVWGEMRTAKLRAGRHPVKVA